MTAETLPRECGAYTLIERIGAGGMAVVYRAVHTKLGNEVAIKMLRREVQDEPKVLELMTSEVRALAQIRHPHVVEVQDVFDSESGEKCLVMELVKAPTLRKMLQQGVPLIFPDVLHIAMQMAQAIGAAHLAGVVHRDLKPDNIAIEERAGSDERRWFVKILDFGVAKLTRGAEGQTENIVGTLAYLAPEVLQGKPADGRADIYGFGVVLFEILAGKLPLDPDSPTDLLKARKGFGPALKEVRPDLPSRFVELVESCTAFSPQDRPASMQHVIASLQQVFARSAAVVHSTWTGAAPDPMRTIFVYAGLGIVLLAAVLFWKAVSVQPLPVPIALPPPASAPAVAEEAPSASAPVVKKKKKKKRKRPSKPSPVEQNLDEDEPLDDPNAEDDLDEP